MAQTKTKQISEIEIIDVKEAELAALCQRARSQQLNPGDAKLIEKLIAAYLHVVKLIRLKNTTIARMRRLFGFRSSEKTKDVLGEPEAAARKGAADSGTSEGDLDPGSLGQAAEQRCGQQTETMPTADQPTPPGHGRNGQAAYEGATRTVVPHPTLKSGDPCPKACGGKVYPWADAHTIVRVYGHSPISAEIWELETFRCNGCLELFVAKAPEAASGPQKYDETAAASIALLHYGMGMPFARLEKLQQTQKVPLPASTQWEIVSRYYPMLQPVFAALVDLAADGTVLHNDDTTARILEWMGKRRAEKEARGTLEQPDRTGLYTTGIVGQSDARTIALFYTGRNHAGENIAKVLAQRHKGLGPPIQMSDGLSANVCHMFEVIAANCLAHGRRLWVDQAANFPSECRFLLEKLSEVFAHERHCKEQHLPDDERLAYHQKNSKPLMDDLKAWLDDLAQNNKIEPNSSLGEPIAYMRKRWEKLTRFLTVAGAPLENNIVERTLKKAIIYRKNSLFYKTEHGANVGSLFTSLICTAEINDANPFDYLTQLFRHPEHIAADPQAWLPWRYTKTVAALSA